MKKVLFVMHNLGFGGAERSLVNLLYELPESKYAVDVLLFQKKGELLKQLPQWVNVLETPKALDGLYAPVARSGRQVFTKVWGTAVSKLARKTKKARAAYRWKNFYCRKLPGLPDGYDVAVAFGGSELMYYVADRVQAKRKLVWIHNDYRTGGYSAKDDAPYLAKMDGIVSISDSCVQVLRQEFPQLQEKMCCIANITSSSLIRSRSEEFTPEEYEKTESNILSVGRLWEQKGFDMAVDAAAMLKDQGVRFCWYVIGEGHLRNALEKQIQDRNVEDCFFLLGTRNNPYPYMKHCCMMVQSSRYEGKSVVLDEAKILAVPTVATAYPTVGDQIADGKEGIIVPMSAEGLAAGIRRMLSDQALADKIRRYLYDKDYGNSFEVQKYMDMIDG